MIKDICLARQYFYFRHTMNNINKCIHFQRGEQRPLPPPSNTPSYMASSFLFLVASLSRSVENCPSSSNKLDMAS